MGRIQKKKTEGQKIKQKAKRKIKSDEPSNGNGAVTNNDIQKKESVKRIQAQKKSIAAQKNKEPGLYEKSSVFLREVKAELKKVVWPPKNQTVASTAVVIVLVIIVSSFLGLFDVGLKGLISMILQ